MGPYIHYSCVVFYNTFNTILVCLRFFFIEYVDFDKLLGSNWIIFPFLTALDSHNDENWQVFKPPSVFSNNLENNDLARK